MGKDSKCTPGCADGSYLTEGTCAKCATSCATCKDAKTCLTCASGLFLNDSNQCLDSCIDGYYANKSTG